MICWLIAIASLVVVSSHNFFATKSQKIILKERAYKKLIKKRNKTFIELKKDHTLLSDYISIQDSATATYSMLKKIRQEEKVFKFKNTNVFLFQTSIFIVLLFISLLFKYLTLQLEYKYLKKTYGITSFIFLLISFYYLLWALYPKSDLPYFLHALLIVTISIPTSFAASYFVNWVHRRTAILNIHKYNFRNLWRFIISDIPKTHLPKENLDNYTKDYMKQIKSFKTLSNEKGKYQN